VLQRPLEFALRALVGVAHELEVGAGLSGPERHPDGVEHEVSAHVAGELPADDHAGEHVDQEREEHAPLPGPQVGEVPDPQDVGPRRGELALDEIWALVRQRIGDRGAPSLPAPLGALDTRAAHQPRDPVTAHLLALPA